MRTGKLPTATLPQRGLRWKKMLTKCHREALLKRKTRWFPLSRTNCGRGKKTCFGQTATFRSWTRHWGVDVGTGSCPIHVTGHRRFSANLFRWIGYVRSDIVRPSGGTWCFFFFFRVSFLHVFLTCSFSSGDKKIIDALICNKHMRSLCCKNN